MTSLMWASYYGLKEVMELLLSAKADVNMKAHSVFFLFLFVVNCIEIFIFWKFFLFVTSSPLIIVFK